MIYNTDDPVILSEDKRAVIAVDQTRLPAEFVHIRLETAEEIFEAVKRLRVRGAPCIGIGAAYGLAVCGLNISESCKSKEDFLNRLKATADYLCSCRPTAVNLSWALNRVYSAAEKNRLLEISQITDILFDEAVKIHREDISTCKKISELGLTLVKSGDGILTHCNAGALATSRYGTGLGPLLLGAEQGVKFHCYVDETRPLLQGARLTAWELSKAGQDVTLICDNMSSLCMKQGKINACFTGCDRVARNGDTANKIGTSAVAILAKHYGIPFYVFCPTSTIDLSCKSGEDIIIEERESDEIKSLFFSRPVAPENIKCYNPAFDVTPAELITAIVTEKGIFYPPYDFENKL